MKLIVFSKKSAFFVFKFLIRLLVLFALENILVLTIITIIEVILANIVLSSRYYLFNNFETFTSSCLKCNYRYYNINVCNTQWSFLTSKAELM